MVRACPWRIAGVLAAPQVLFSDPAVAEHLIALVDILSTSLQFTHTSNHHLLHALLLNAPLLRHLPLIPLPAASDDDAQHANGAGGSGFIPTAAWLDEWQARLPLRAIFAMLDALEPRVPRERLLRTELPEALKVTHHIMPRLHVAAFSALLTCIASH